jgi:hypothetical protein
MRRRVVLRRVTPLKKQDRNWMTGPYRTVTSPLFAYLIEPVVERARFRCKRTRA